MSQPTLSQLKAEDLSAEDYGYEKAQQAIDDLYMAANSDETLKSNSKQLLAQESWSR
jgi:hypothetical protein